MIRQFFQESLLSYINRCDEISIMDRVIEYSRKSFVYLFGVKINIFFPYKIHYIVMK